MSILDTFWSHPVEQLEKALQLRKQIASLQENLSAIFASGLAKVTGKAEPAEAAKTTGKRRGRRKMSAEAREKIAAAQRARWAKSKGSAVAEPAVAAKATPARRGPKKGGMSAEGRARIIAAQKARWAKVRADKGAPAPAPAKGGRRKKRNLSPEARARIVAAVKARWAREKKGKK